MLEKLLNRYLTNKKSLQPLAFSIKLVGAYILWKILSYFLETYQPPFWIDLQNQVAYMLVRSSSFVLQHIVGYDLIYNSRNILIKDTEGIYVADHCLGIPASFVFTAAILFFSGKWYHKLWYIPTGILGICFLNTIRLSALGITQKVGSPLAFYINHSYTFLIIIYGLIFLMVMFWMEKFSEE